MGFTGGTHGTNHPILYMDLVMKVLRSGTNLFVGTVRAPTYREEVEECFVWMLTT